MKRIINEMPMLQYLSRLKKKEQKDLISGAPKQLLICLSEIALNVVFKHLNLNKTQIKKLKKFEQVIISLSQKKHSLVKRKKLLGTGNFLHNFLGAVMPPLTLAAIRQPTGKKNHD